MSEPLKLQVERRSDLIDSSAWIAPTAVVLGNVTVKPHASIWYHAVLRGDAEAIVVGEGSNVQDQCVLHADPGYPCTLGDRVTVGHAAVVHGATVEDDCMIGMRAVVMNGARIGTGSLVGVGAVVTEGKEIPPGSLVLGVPGRVVRSLSEQDRARIRHAADHYVAAAAQYAAAESATSPGEPSAVEPSPDNTDGPASNDE